MTEKSDLAQILAPHTSNGQLPTNQVSSNCDAKMWLYIKPDIWTGFKQIITEVTMLKDVGEWLLISVIGREFQTAYAE